MMKKMLFVMVMLIISLGATYAGPGRSDDYKVIKNAVKSEKAEAPAETGKLSWFRIEVTEHGRSTVKIRIPLSIIETLAESCPNDFRTGRDCHIDIRRVLADLKKAGPLALIEIEDHDETVKIWVE